MTNEAKKQLLTEQVLALATIILTRRNDLTIVETKKATGVDLLTCTFTSIAKTSRCA